MEILIAATKTGAEAAGRSNDRGTIAPGKPGDLVRFGADPLTSVQNSSEVVGVVVPSRAGEQAPEWVHSMDTRQVRGETQNPARGRNLRRGLILS